MSRGRKGEPTKVQRDRFIKYTAKGMKRQEIAFGHTLESMSHTKTADIERVGREHNTDLGAVFTVESRGMRYTTIYLAERVGPDPGTVEHHVSFGEEEDDD